MMLLCIVFRAIIESVKVLQLSRREPRHPSYLCGLAAADQAILQGFGTLIGLTARGVSGCG